MYEDDCNYDDEDEHTYERYSGSYAKDAEGTMMRL